MQERQAHQASTHPPESASTSSTMRANGKAGGTAHVSIKHKVDGNGTASKKQRAPETGRSRLAEVQIHIVPHVLQVHIQLSAKS